MIGESLKKVLSTRRNPFIVRKSFSEEKNNFKKLQFYPLPFKKVYTHLMIQFFLSNHLECWKVVTWKALPKALLKKLDRFLENFDMESIQSLPKRNTLRPKRKSVVFNLNNSSSFVGLKKSPKLSSFKFNLVTKSMKKRIFASKLVGEKKKENGLNSPILKAPRKTYKTNNIMI